MKESSKKHDPHSTVFLAVSQHNCINHSERNHLKFAADIKCYFTFSSIFFRAARDRLLMLYRFPMKLFVFFPKEIECVCLLFTRSPHQVDSSKSECSRTWNVKQSKATAESKNKRTGCRRKRYIFGEGEM